MDSTRFYDDNASTFVEQTFNVDMAELRSRFLKNLPKGASILDAGCGSGRDALAFKQAGYDVCAFDASSEMVAEATSRSGLPVRQMRFENFSWERDFDGVWACASLLHVFRRNLPMVFQRLAKNLTPDGVIYASFKYGSDERRRKGRYFNDMTRELIDPLLQMTPELAMFDFWISKDQRPERGSERWLNCLFKKVGGQQACTQGSGDIRDRYPELSEGRDTIYE